MSQRKDVDGQAFQITEPLEPWVERVIDRALLRHAQSCPLAPRVTRLEIRISALIGFMVGSGLLGGVTGAYLAGAFGWVKGG